jgi:hypothetical protein
LKEAVVVLMMLVSVLSHAEYELKTSWGLAMTAGKNTTQISDMVVNDSVVFVVGTGLTKTESDAIMIGDKEVAVGTASNANNGNAVYVLACIGREGDLRWSIYSKGGDVKPNDCFVSPTADGGVVTVLSVRHPDYAPIGGIAIVDSKGRESNLGWKIQDKTQRYYRIVVMKATAEGEIEWVRMAEVDHSPVAGTEKVVEEGFGLRSVLVAGAGDIYIAGRQQKAIKMATSATDSLEWQPVFVDGWDGVTSNQGGMFIAKLDKNGYLRRVVQMEGEAKESNVLDLKASGGKIYALGTLTFEGETEVRIGSKKMSYVGENSKNQAITIGKFTMDLDEEALWYYPSNLTGTVVNYADMSIEGGDIYVVGKMKYGMAIEGAETITTGELTRDGIAFRVSKEDGTVKDGRALGKIQSGYAGMYKGRAGTYLFAQTSSGGEYIMEAYDGEDLTEPSRVETLIATASDIKGVVSLKTEEGARVIVAIRAGAKANALYGGEVSMDLPSGRYSGEIAAYDIKEKGQDGTSVVELRSEEKEDNGVYDMTGRRVGRRSEIGTMRRGLYVAGGRLVRVR